MGVSYALLCVTPATDWARFPAKCTPLVTPTRSPSDRATEHDGVRADRFDLGTASSRVVRSFNASVILIN